MMQVKPVASASPNGDFHVNRRFRWIPTHTLQRIQADEDNHREHVVARVERCGIYTKEFWPTAPTPIIGSRRAVINKVGGLRSYHSLDGYGSYGDYKRSAESRGHSRAKKPWRRNRQRDIFF